MNKSVTVALGSFILLSSFVYAKSSLCEPVCGRIQETTKSSWLRAGAYMTYEQLFVWSMHNETDYMTWNITRFEGDIADLHLISHGIDVTDGNVTLTSGDANLTMNVSTREVINCSDLSYVGEKWPFWIEQNVTWGSEIDIWYGTSIIGKDEQIHILGEERDCWVVEYNWTTACMKRWYDKTSGIVLKIHVILYHENITIAITETAILTSVDLSGHRSVHNLNTGLNYTTIQEAIDANETLNGHTIFVEEGTYYEHVVVDKSLSLIGESRDTTVIDGNGTGTVVQISTDNITVANFTARNGGHGKSWLDSCICGNYHSNIKIENNTVTNATNGIIFYGFVNSTIRHNFAEGLGLIGLHLDGDSTDCTIEDNTVINCLEGIEIERSAGNLVEGNQLICNNASIVLNSCGGSNVLRNNKMASKWYNLLVWGFSLEDFIQDIDTSNTLNNKTAHYIINSNNLFIDPSGYPDLGYLAVVNCTNLTIKDTDLSYNLDGLLVVQSTDCCLANITLGGNRGPLLYGSLTFFRANNNSMVNSRIGNNSVGVCLYQSYNNNFYHNAFVDIDKPVVSDFHSPFSPPSGSHSIVEWDNGFEGNHWSDYTGVDLDHDGIGDTPYLIDANNTDHYPLMGTFSDFDVTAELHVQTICNSSISDFQFNGTAITFNVTGEDDTAGFCRMCIPTALMSDYQVFVNGTLVPHDLLPPPISNSTHSYIIFNYTHSTQKVIVIPEFSLSLILPLFMTATLLVVITYRRKHIKQ